MHYQQITSVLDGDKTICPPLTELFFILFELQHLLQFSSNLNSKSGAHLRPHNYRFNFGNVTCGVSLDAGWHAEPHFWDETRVAQTTACKWLMKMNLTCILVTGLTRILAKSIHSNPMQSRRRDLSGSLLKATLIVTDVRGPRLAGQSESLLSACRPRCMYRLPPPPSSSHFLWSGVISRTVSMQFHTEQLPCCRQTGKWSGAPQSARPYTGLSSVAKWKLESGASVCYAFMHGVCSCCAPAEFRAPQHFLRYKAEFLAACVIDNMRGGTWRVCVSEIWNHWLVYGVDKLSYYSTAVVNTSWVWVLKVQRMRKETTHIH